MAKEVIFEKLSKEIENNVSIVSQNVMESYNASWEEWKRNTTLTAAFVSEEGAADYLIYGEIRNNSKFDLPIELLVEGDLFMIEDLSAKEGSSGAVLRDVTKSIVKAMEGDKAAKAYQKALDEATTKKSFLKKGSQKYYIPYLPAKQKNLYAIFIPFGNMTKKSGTNIMESYNFTKTLKFENTPVKIDIFKGTTSTTQLNKQKDWLKMSKNGLPNANLMDTWRGITYNASDWEMKYQEQQEEMRRWREEQRRLEQETTEQSESVDYTDDVKISIRKEKSHENSINIYIDNDDWFMEDAEYTIVTITPNEGSYEDAERYDQNNDISKTYKNAKSVEVTITYKVGGKIQSGSRIINGKGDWKITIDD